MERKKFWSERIFFSETKGEREDLSLGIHFLSLGIHFLSVYILFLTMLSPKLLRPKTEVLRRTGRCRGEAPDTRTKSLRIVSTLVDGRDDLISRGGISSWQHSLLCLEQRVGSLRLENGWSPTVLSKHESFPSVPQGAGRFPGSESRWSHEELPVPVRDSRRWGH